MLKAKATTNNGQMMVLGLTDENLERLKKGQPIKFNMESMGMQKCDVLIFHAKDENALREISKNMIDPLNTIIHDYQAPNN